MYLQRDSFPFLTFLACMAYITSSPSLLHSLYISLPNVNDICPGQQPQQAAAPHGQRYTGWRRFGDDWFKCNRNYPDTTKLSPLFTKPAPNRRTLLME